MTQLVACGSRFLALAPALALALACAAAAQTAEPTDTVVLTDGKTLAGLVLRQDENEVLLRVGTRDRTIPRASVRSVDSIAARHRLFLNGWRSVPADDAAQLLEMAQAATHARLPHETRLMLWYAALARPKEAAIHELLGNRQQGGRFLVQIDGAWVPFEKADALGEDFGKAWLLRSRHFSIRCAAGLRAALDTLLDLEALYWAMQDLFGKDLKLLEICETIDVRLYRSRQQMPGIGTHVGAVFAADEAALFTCFENGKAFALAHEGTHALLHYLFVRAARSRGALPGWLEEGWAEYMLGRLDTKVPGKPVLRERSEMPGHRAVLAEAARRGDLYGVHRLLNLKSSDFMASSLQDIKYAQAWALFRYLIENGNTQLRASFVDYLREATAGRGQASTFRRIFARQEQQLETEPWK